MWVYLTILVLLWIGALVEINSKKAKKISKIIYLIMVFIISFRYQIGVDWIGYENYFNDNRIDGIEKGFIYFNNIFHFFQINFYWSSFFYSIFSLVVIYIFLKKYFYIICLPISLFLYKGFIYLSIDQVRQFLALGLSLIAINFFIEKKKLLFLVFIFLGTFFHKSILVLLLLCLYKKKELSYFKLINLFILSLLTGLFGLKVIFYIINFIEKIGFFNPYFMEKILVYLKDTNIKNAFTIGNIERNIVYIVVIFYLLKDKYKNDRLNIFIFIYILYNSIGNIFILIPNFSLRLSYYFIFGMIYCISFAILKIQDRKISMILITIYLSISTLYFFKNTIYLNTLIPYKNYIVNTIFLNENETGRKKAEDFWKKVVENNIKEKGER